MKCPSCGQWNRASFPKCIKCGTILPQEGRGPLPAEELTAPKEAPVVIRVDEMGNEVQLVDEKDSLAAEMQTLHQRKRRGETQQQALRSRGAERGIAPTGSGVSAVSRRNRMFQDADVGQDRMPNEDGAYTVEPAYAGPYARHNAPAVLPPRSFKRTRLFGLRRFLPIAALVLLILGGLAALFMFVVKPSFIDPKPVNAQEQVEVIASILDDMAAHTIRIPAPDGTQIYIKELRRSFLSTGGYASFQVPDYTWYELEETLSEPVMSVTLTPFVRTGTGEQKAMPLITYDIDIPQSPLTLISPEATYVEVSTPVYNIRFHVMQNSTVLINGVDFSSFVNTQNGYISYNADIQPIGENKIRIVVRSQYYRQNEATLTIYRAIQDIPLDLSSVLDDESSGPTMWISATTMPGATISVLSPFEEADFSELNSTGAFRFKAVFNKVGINTVTIQAEYPGKEPTIVNYNVYYLPSPDQYTPKAWALDGKWGYQDFLANKNTRIANTQIYVMQGEVKRIINNRPQLVEIDVSDGQGKPLPVLVENQTKTEWVVGQRYRIYGDAYGMYDGFPWVIGRFTYKPRN